MRLLTRLLGALAIALACGSAPAAPVLSLVPSTQKLHPPEMFHVDVVLTGLEHRDAGSLLSAFDFRIYYDDSRTPLMEYSFGDALGSVTGGFSSQALYGDEGTWVGNVGILRLFEISLLEGSIDGCLFCAGPYLQDLQGDSILLATLTFLSVAASPSEWITNFHIPAGQVTLVDANGMPITDFSVEHASVAMPEPGALALASLGLTALGLAASRRRRMVRR